ncbi:MAG TPA: transcription antitermination factor NusB [Acidimicrobiales bacterium]|nr:transcription antitermination factor NusB [Acidimicrobiales bacterium]
MSERPGTGSPRRHRSGGDRRSGPGGAGTARALALDALDRIDPGGAYANLLLPELLRRSRLEPRDRHFATELVYGTTRMRRACDHLVDRFLSREVEPRVRNALRLGAYQLHVLGLPAHAAVGETVAVAPKAARGLVNAVLRRVATTPAIWPDDATRLSYPDWVVEQLRADLGVESALAALEVMDTAPTVTEREDGYVQDLASQWVAEAVGAQPGERVADLCAAPGGKATLLAATGATVVAADIRASRAGLVDANARAEHPLHVLTADAARPPFAPASFDRVLIDAPCSGLGTLRRRPDARWRLDPDAPNRLAAVQRSLVDAAADLVRPGGHLVYSVCTLTDVESLGVDEHLAAARPDLVAEPPPGAPWEPHGRGARLVPQAAGTDGMYLLRLRRGS